MCNNERKREERREKREERREKREERREKREERRERHLFLYLMAVAVVMFSRQNEQ